MRQKIKTIQCPYCKKDFDVNTEDIEWEHLEDLGEVDDNNDLHDFGLFQKVTCSHCYANIQIVFNAKGKNVVNISSMDIIETPAL